MHHSILLSNLFDYSHMPKYFSVLVENAVDVVQLVCQLNTSVQERSIVHSHVGELVHEVYLLELKRTESRCLVAERDTQYLCQFVDVDIRLKHKHKVF